MTVERVQKMVLDEVIRLGAQGYEKLAAKAEISVSTLRAIARDGHMPSAQTIHQLALACGLSGDAALELTKERMLMAKETA
jgi:transcriptional regulator with XRE-family HTH domain